MSGQRTFGLTAVMPPLCRFCGADESSLDRRSVRGSIVRERVLMSNGFSEWSDPVSDASPIACRVRTPDMKDHNRRAATLALGPRQSVM